MSVYISTNCFIKTGFPNVFRVLEILRDRIDDDGLYSTIGIEIFPDFDNEQFVKDLDEYMEKIRNYPVTLHGPYFRIEHSAPEGTPEYERAEEEFIRVLELGEKTASDHIVFHHNNRRIDSETRLELIDNARKNLRVLNGIAEEYGVPILIENAGVDLVGNNIFTEDEFIEECRSSENYVLIDIGHANANGWNLERVMRELKDRIHAYHVHNNDGRGDGHESIYNGTLDFNKFMDLYRELTPEAHIVVEYGYQFGDRHEDIAYDVMKILDSMKA